MAVSMAHHTMTMWIVLARHLIGFMADVVLCLQVASVIDMPPLALLPHCLLQQRVRPGLLHILQPDPCSGQASRARGLLSAQSGALSTCNFLQVLRPMRVMVGGTMLVSVLSAKLHRPLQFPRALCR